MPTSTLVVAVLNEIDGLKLIMPRVKSSWCERVLILDGGSTDGSIEWCLENGYEVYVQKEPGLRKGYSEIWTSLTTDYVITFSPDNNSIPEVIPELQKAIEASQGDMVIASRYLGYAKSDDDDLVTAFGNWLFTRLINVLHSGSYTDAMVMYRIYRVGLPVDLDLMNDRWYAWLERPLRCSVSWEPLLSVRASRAKLTLGEIPASEPIRIGGKRKLKIIRWGVLYAFQVLLDRLLFPLNRINS